MSRYVGCLLILSGILCSSPVAVAVEETSFSENTAAVFAKQAQELYLLDPLNSRQVEQSMTLLDAALELDKTSVRIPELMLSIGASACFTGEDYSPRLSWSLDRYVGNRADLEIAGQTVNCMLEHLNSRQEREDLLQKLLGKYDSVNAAFASDLAAQLGLLAAERADMNKAIQDLSMAYQLNHYNQLAFMKVQELTAGENLSVTPEAYIVQLRTALDINPFDLSIAVDYADMLMHYQLYDFAEKAYEYTAKQYQAADPGKPLPEDLAFSWLTSCYLAPQTQQKCLDLIEKFRQKDRFDIKMEALAAKAAAKAGQIEKAKNILEQAGLKAEHLLNEKELVQQITPEELAWFYSFIVEQPEKALAWSNKAYQEAPDRQGVRTMFAYTLAQSGQMQLAKEQAQLLGETDQVASLTLAIVLAAEDKSKAIEALKTTISMKPYSFVAEKAVKMLRDLGSDYAAPSASDSMRNAIVTEFKEQVVPDAAPASKRFNARLLFGGSEFFYGTDFSPRLLIENTGQSPLVITDGSFLSGNLRIDAVVSGDLNAEIPNLINRKFKPSKPILPLQHLSIPLDLQTGKLQKLLKTYPQASLKIEFIVYLDPIEDANQKPRNALKDVAPFRAVIQRTAVSLTTDFLMQRLDALSKGQEGQRFRAIELLTGLLAEQKAFERKQASFRHMKAEHALLVDTVRKALVDENWKIRVLTMDNLMTLSIPLEYGMVKEISLNLNHEKWPVRLMAMLVLAKAQPGSFEKVLDWAAQYDPNLLNRRMADSLKINKIEKVSQNIENGDPNTP